MKKLLPVFLVLGVLAFLVFLFVKSNRPSSAPATIAEQATEASVEATALFEAYQRDETAANELYLNKIVKVSGVVARSEERVGGGGVVLLRSNDPELGVRCRLDLRPGQAAKRYEAGQSVTFKCLCSGLVQDVELVQCID